LFDSNQTSYNKECLFPNIILLKNRVCAEQKTIYASVCNTVAMSIADMLLLADFLYPEKCHTGSVVAHAHNTVT
jgi:hypothetical protein